MKVAFSKAIKNLQENYKDYLTEDREKGYAVTNKDHSVYQEITINLPNVLREEIKARNYLNHSYLNIKGSTGNGRVGDSFWIALLDERITDTTTKGIYIVFLFDKNLDNLYLTIASGTENLNMTKIKAQTEKRRKHFEQQINTFEELSSFSIGEITLGKSERAKKFAASVCIHKQYKMNNLDFEHIMSDLEVINNYYYAYIFDQYLEEGEIIQDKEQLKEKKGINKFKYQQMREEQAIRNKKIGDLAEEFILNLEKNRLRESGNDDLANKVEWVASLTDGLGYDIRSFFPDGTEKFIEVKGTALDLPEFNFYISRNEVEVSKVLKESYVLALVNKVGTNKIEVIHELRDPLNKINELVPVNYKGTVRKV
ncbi:DUF3578 domain-containing protein [Bacillus sp. A116_S68]|nr:DUF3578 domain-containing protein [Bacillus sp. A116_S68]